MRAAVTTVGSIAGLCLVAVGAAMIWLPLGVIAAGAALFVVCETEGAK